MAAPSSCDNISDEELGMDSIGEVHDRIGSASRFLVPGDEDSKRVSVDGGAMSDTLEDFRRQWKSEINSQNLHKRFCRAPPLSKRGQVVQQGNTKPFQRNNSNVDIRSLKKTLGNMGVTKKSDNCLSSERLVESDDEGSESSVEIFGDKQDRSDDDGEKSLLITVDSLPCKPGVCQEASHISGLPLEVLHLIFKWVVSSYLDVDSLERLSLVCKGFYLLARDEDLWKSICMRTWGKIALQPGYLSYREMFIERPHVMFGGCYISKATYFRQGERSFDGYERPFHSVTYYRYIRFYPEGKVYMFMSPEQPKDAVAYLKNNLNYVQGLQYGYYKLTDDKVSLVLKKIPEPSVKSKRFAKNSQYYNDCEQTFCLEMSLKTIKRRRNSQLSWIQYIMHNVNKTSGESTTMTFDISANMYPPFYFTPVRSFAAQSDSPL